MDYIKIEKQGRKLYIDAGKDLKIHKISKSVTYLQLLKNIDLEMLPHLKKFRRLGDQNNFVNL